MGFELIYGELGMGFNGSRVFRGIFNIIIWREILWKIKIICDILLMYFLLMIR